MEDYEINSGDSKSEKDPNYENQPAELEVGEDSESKASESNLSISAASLSISDESKDYLEAPYSYSMSKNETVVLNNGALQHTVTDFALPGRNGFDLKIIRRYDSCRANTTEMSPDFYGDNQFRTGSRDNSHYPRMYGLGYGWHFVLPSIEVAPEKEQGSDTPVYHQFLRLEDGRSLEIDGSSLKDHPLHDVIIQQVSGNITHPYRAEITKQYDTIVKYKDESKDYFQKTYDSDNKLDCYKLVARQDRFDNAIFFSMSDYGGMTVMDSWGRDIVLAKSGNTMTWTLPDSTSAEPRKIVYTTNDANGKRLTQVLDQKNRKTQYEYYDSNEYKAVSKYMSEEYGDSSNVEFAYLLLKSITHPTNAVTHYEYGVVEGTAKKPIKLTIGSYDGYRQHFPLYSRKDTASGGDYHIVQYTYEVSSDKKYIQYSNVKRLNNVTERHEFNDRNQHIYAETKHTGVLTSACSYEYGTDSAKEDYKLIVKEDTKRYNKQSQAQFLQKITQWKYTSDKKANITKITEEYPSDSAFNQETNILYGAYSIILEKNYKKDSSTVIYEKYALRSSPDNKVAEYKRVYENSMLKEKTQYIYSDNNNKYCVTQERRYYVAGNEKLEDSVSFYSTDYTYNSAKRTHASVTREISGIKSADGDPVQASKETYDYDACGRIISSMDANGRTTGVTYDALGRVTEEKYPIVEGLQHSQKICYNDSSNYITTTDENGFKKRLEYTPLGKIKKVYLAVADTPDTNKDVLTAEYSYDALERLEQELTYDGNGFAVGNVKRKMSYVYDQSDRVLSKTVAPVDYKEIYDYIDVYTDPSDMGKKYFREQKTISGDNDAPDVMTVVYADQFGRARKKFAVNDRIATYVYDKLGNKIQLIDAKSKTTQWAYDYAGRLVSTVRRIDSQDRTTTTEYDALGNKKYVWDYAGQKAEFYYDSAGRLIKRISPFDSRKAVTKYYYDPAGNQTWQKLDQGEYLRETEYRYDARNRQTDIILYKFKNPGNLTGAKWIRTSYKYDSVGNKLEIRTGYTESDNSHTISKYTYDRFGNVLTFTDALGKSEQYKYNNVGVPQYKIDRNGNRIDYRNDELDRVTKESVTVDNPSGKIVSERECFYARTGDKIKEINRVSENGQAFDILTIEYKYNNKGQIERQTDPDGVVKEYTYDLNGNRETFKLFRNSLTTPEINLYYGYDDLNRLQTVKRGGASGTIIAKYDYDENGNRKTLQYPQNNIETVYKYNYANLVVSLENKKNNAVVSSWEYTYYLDGNPSEKICKTTRKSRTTSYKYDRIGRLVEESDQDWNTAVYEYDKYSNRVKMTVSGSEDYITTYENNSNNRLIKEVKKQGRVTETFSYRYDGNGNQCYREWEKIEPASKEPGRMEFCGEEREDEPAMLDWREYDGFDQLIKVRRPPTDTHYHYRPDGLRHSKTIANPFSGAVQKTIHYWDGQDMVMETVGGVIKNRYLRGINLIAQQIDSSLFYYLFNVHGDVVQRVGGDGSSAPMYEYDAFGNEKNPIKTDPNPFRYCGEYWDSETESYYIRARYYNPANGRWLSEDSARSGLNWYTYCDSNPVSYVDSNGEFAVTAALVGTAIAIGLAGAIIGGLVGGISAAVNHENVRAGAIGGAVTGAVSAVVGYLAPIAAVPVAVVASGTNAYVQGKINNNLSWPSIIASGTASGITAGLGVAVGNSLIDPAFKGVTGGVGIAARGIVEFTASVFLSPIDIAAQYGMGLVANGAYNAYSSFSMPTFSYTPSFYSPAYTPPIYTPTYTSPVYTPPAYAGPTWVDGYWVNVPGYYNYVPGGMVWVPGGNVWIPLSYEYNSATGQYGFVGGYYQYVPGSYQWVNGYSEWVPGYSYYVSGYWKY